MDKTGTMAKADGTCRMGIKCGCLVLRVGALRRKLLEWAVTYRQISGNIVFELSILRRPPL